MSVKTICTFEDWKALYEGFGELAQCQDEFEATFEEAQDELKEAWPEYWNRYKKEVLLWP